MGPGPHREGTGDRAVAGVLVVVQEDPLAAVLLPPLDGHQVRRPTCHLPADRDRGVPHIDEVPARLDRDEDVQSTSTGGLRPARHPELVEDLAHHCGRGRPRRGSRCPAAGRDPAATHRGGPRRVRSPPTGWNTMVPRFAHQAITAGSVGRDLVGGAARGERDLRGSRSSRARASGRASGRTPRRGSTRRPRCAIVTPGSTPSGQRSSAVGRSTHVLEHQLRHGGVVLHHLQLGVARLGEVDLVRVGHPHLAASRPR